jgi:tetratricopeptide (TPR) repeat protein/DNA-binding CsgD family transcriptional regulator
MLVPSVPPGRPGRRRIVSAITLTDHFSPGAACPRDAGDERCGRMWTESPSIYRGDAATGARGHGGMHVSSGYNGRRARSTGTQSITGRSPIWGERHGANVIPYVHMAGSTITSESLEALRAQVKASFRQKPVEAYDMARHGIEIAERHGYKRLAVEFKMLTVHIGLLLHCADDFTGLLKEVRDYARSKRDRKTEARMLLEMACIDERTGNDSGAIRACRRAAKLMGAIDRIDGQATANQKLASLYRRVGDLPKALEHALTALELFEKSGQRRGIATCNNELGMLYWRSKDADAARRHLLCAREAYRSLEDRIGEAIALSNLSGMLGIIGETEKALEYGRQALKIFRRIGATARVGNMLNNLGACYEQSGRPGMALRYYNAALRLLESSNGLPYLAATISNAAWMYVLKRDFRRAERLYQRALEVAIARNERNTLYAIHYARYRMYLEMNDLPKALEAFEIFHSIREDIVGADAMNEVSHILREYQARRSENELAGERRRSGELQSELEKRTAELRELTLQMIRKNELIIKLREDVTRNAEIPPSAKQALIAQLDSEDPRKEGVNAFLQRFAQVHPEFRSSLAARHPELTPAEVRVCCLLYLDFSSKEIASLLHVSSSTVDLHRTRIRRKCGLSREDSLAGFLASIRP